MDIRSRHRSDGSTRWLRYERDALGAGSRFLILLGALVVFTDLTSCRSVGPATRVSNDASASATISEGPALPFGCSSHAGGVIHGRIVIAGGTTWNLERTHKTFLDDTLVYEEGRWTPGPALPAPLAEGAFAADGAVLYLVGGLSSPDQPTNIACKISQIDQRLVTEKLPSLPFPTSAGGAAIQDGKLYLACGYLDGKPSNQFWSLDISTPNGQWTPLASLPGPARAYPAMVASGSDLFLLGGLGGGDATVHDRTFGDAYRYIPASNQWTRLKDLPMAGYCWSACPLNGGRLLLAGRADRQIHNEIWSVDLDTLDFQLLGHAVIQATCAPLVPLNGQTFWLIGGEPDSLKHRTNRVSMISLH